MAAGRIDEVRKRTVSPRAISKGDKGATAQLRAVISSLRRWRHDTRFAFPCPLRVAVIDSPLLTVACLTRSGSTWLRHHRPSCDERPERGGS